MAYYGGGPGGLRRALFPQLNYENMIGQEQPDQMRQLQPRVLPDPGQVPTPPQVGPGTMSPQELGALGRGGTAQYLYPDERQIRRGANRPNVQPTGTQNLMSALVGARPRSEEDLGRLDMAKNMGLIGSGLSLISTIGGVQRPDLPGHPGSLGRNLADALSLGITAARGTYGATKQEPPQIVSGPGGGLYSVDPRSGDVTNVVEGQGDDYTLASGATRYDDQGNVVARGAEEGPSSALRDAATVLGVDLNHPISDIDRGRLRDQMERMKSGGITINTGDEAPAVVGDDSLVGFIDSWMDKTSTLLPTISRIDQAMQIVNDPEFAKVSGPMSGIRTGARQWFTALGFSDGAALVLSAEFDQIMAAEGMAELAGFTGPKTEAEQLIAWSMAMANRDLTAEELKAGLAMRRRMKISEQAVGAERILATQDSLFGENEASRDFHVSQARQIWDLYVEEMEKVYADGDKARETMTARQRDIALGLLTY